MKKIIPLTAFFLLFLCSCTIQKEMDSQLFLSRFSEKFPDYRSEIDEIFFEDDKSVVFVNDIAGNRFALEMKSDLQGRVQKISLACSGADKAECLLSFAKDVLLVFAPDEDIEAVFQSITDGDYFSYYETLWYSYAFSQTENGTFLSVENKRFAPERESGLTLKENESIS